MCFQEETCSHKKEAGEKRETARRQGFDCRTIGLSNRKGASGTFEARNSKFLLKTFYETYYIVCELLQYGDIYNFSQVAFNKALDAEELQEEDEEMEDEEDEEQEDEELVFQI